MTSPQPQLGDSDPSAGLFGASVAPYAPAHRAVGVEEILEDLTDPQRRAVLHRGGPLLIVAGAGSGKTRVLTRRIAHLLASGDARPHEIMAITFTNKAAGEMRERVEALFGPRAKRMLLATFHSACLRILRANATRIGFEPGFTVYDATDSKRLIEMIMADQNIDTKAVPARSVTARISEAKARLQTPDDLMASVAWAASPPEQAAASVYPVYQARLRSANAMDFDDLLMKTVELFRDCPDVLEAYQQRYRHILVDEYQDTNAVQNTLVLMLASSHGNVCVVGDSDQSIYKFRAADISNILDFEKTFPEATTVVLEQNFRSTQNILDAANAVIKNNPGRPEKRLFTEDGAGPPIRRFRAGDERDEAIWVASEITRLRVHEGVGHGDIAIIYRTNAQSRVIEEELVRSGVHYKVIGGIRYYDRKEIKDVLAYVRLLANPQDEISARRIINVPKRGIGATSVAAIGQYARDHQLSFGEAIEYGGAIGSLTPKASKAVIAVAELLASIRAQMEPVDPLGATAADPLYSIDDDEAEVDGDAGTGSFAVEAPSETGYLDPGSLVRLVVEQSGYLAELTAEGTHEAESRIENITQLVTVASSYETLEEFLSMVALVSDADELGEAAERVSLMTLHIAKGLEYPAVFLVGLEEGIFPHSRSLDSGDPDDIEEERRLAYVGITRARAHLAVSHAWTRSQWGQTTDALPSRFLSEIPAELIEDIGPTDSPRRRDSSGWSLPSRSRSDDDGGRVFGAGTANRAEPTSTGAHLLDLEIGDTVIHERWGAGRVNALSGAGDRRTAKVRFASVGDKTLMLSMAPLSKG